MKQPNGLSFYLSIGRPAKPRAELQIKGTFFIRIVFLWFAFSVISKDYDYILGESLFLNGKYREMINGMRNHWNCKNYSTGGTCPKRSECENANKWEYKKTHLLF